MDNKILIVEDIAALRRHAAQLISQNIAGSPAVHEAADGQRGLKLYQSLQPELVIMDICLPEMSGIKAARQIWSGNPRAKILFWSQFHKEAYVRELGKIVPDEAIHGYALKSEPDEKLVEAITSILLHDNPYIDPVVRGVQSRLQSKGQFLSDVEYETLLDVAAGLTDRAIAFRRHISVRGVQNRLSMLLSKLLAGEDAVLRESAGMEIYNPRTRVVFKALERGLIDTDEIPAWHKGLVHWLESEFDYNDNQIGAI